MHLDVQDLRNFYYRSALGRAAQSVVRDELRRLWSDVEGQTVVGYGFAAPVLRPFLSNARRVTALMPAPQGVMPWPPGMANVSVLCEEANWPLETGYVDRLVLLHGLETSENPTRLLKECWRVLGPGGRIVVIVPNRAGRWARRDATPFGFGRPYSMSQLEAQLRDHAFIPERHRSMLYQPPSEKRFWRQAGPLVERIGMPVSAMLSGGVVMVEASKRVYPPPGGEPIRRLRVLEGLAPQPKPMGVARILPDQ